jgi:hypothetical protein
VDDRGPGDLYCGNAGGGGLGYLPGLSEPRYPAFEWDAPWLPEVQRVLLSSEPYRFREQHVDEVGRLSGLPASLIDGEMASWYGSRAIEGLRHLAALRRSLAAA